MLRSGPQDLSLRAIARELGMAPSALYRYFASRDELLTALIIDAYDALAAALLAAYERAHRRRIAPTASETFLLVAQAYRRWALHNTVEYRLIFGTSIAGYTGTEQTTAASLRSGAVLLRIMADMIAEDAVDLDATDRLLTPALRTKLEAWSVSIGSAVPAKALAPAMFCYGALHGAINLDVNDHLPPPLARSEDLFTAAMRHAVDAVSKQPVGRPSVR